MISSVRDMGLAVTRTSIAVLAGVCGLAVGIRGQVPQPGPTVFRANSTLIDVYVSVTDQRGQVVRDLTVGDFSVEHDGRPQPIAQFAFVDGPRTSQPADSVARDGTTMPTQIAQPGNVYVLLLDDLRGGRPDELSSAQVARMFVEQTLADSDLAAVVTTSGRDGTEQPVTTNRALLLRAIAAQAAQGSPPSPATLVRRVTQRLESTATWLKDVLPGRRKILVYFGADMPGLGGYTDPTTPFMPGVDRGIGGTARPAPPQVQGLNQTAQAADARRAVLALRQANVPVYAIAPRGLGALLGRGDDAASATGTTRGTTAAALTRSSSLHDLAEQTGGRALTNSNSFSEFFARIAQDASAYYVLAYAPPAGMQPGRTYPITVKVDRQGVDLLARKSVTLPER